ncbi:hypothetical protein RHMOL_Rhmol10G0165800 [Rhododendron molle]|uniref:Uncharacterized protein n=1 Tax=Rhododendron molle TaxID=49168 RepID=A0ACC0M304_RHOML|nr:hypothetical protein RHMOL_Rhmol10G0165800 [Rhododendron molle]
MADGTLSMADGLGLKTIDSHELRRRHQFLDLVENPQIHPPQMSNPRSPILFELDNPNVPVSSDLSPRFHSRGTDPASLLVSTSKGFGAQSPKSASNPNLSWNFQQVFMEGSLKLEAEEQVHHLQEVDKVQDANPNPKMLFNVRGNPYVEGDPNMGYPVEAIQPSHFVQRTVGGSLTPNLGLDSTFTSHKPPFRAPHAQPQAAPTPHHHLNSNTHAKPLQAQQPNPKSNTGQNKPKPKNWASLLQSQSPSLDMKLEYFPDLHRGKEALVEIDLELTEKEVDQSSPHKIALSHQNIPSSVRSLTPCPDPSSIEEDSEDSENELLEVLEGVVTSVVHSHKITTPSTNIGTKLTENTVHEQSNQAANKAAKSPTSDTEVTSNDQNLVGADKKGEPPDLLTHAISDVKLMQGGSNKAGHNGKNRSQSKGSSRKQRK